MGWIYGSDELAKAIVQASESYSTQGEVNSIIYSMYKDGGINAVYDFAKANGVTPVYNSSGYATFYKTSELINSSTFQAPSVYAEALEIDAVESTATEIAYKSLPAITEKQIEKSGIQTLVKSAPVIGAIATGIGLGVKAYKDEPAFWTDLSSDIFSGDVEGVFNVVARKVSGNYVSYVSEDDVANIVHTFAKNGVFDTNVIESTLPSVFEGGSIPTDVKAINLPQTAGCSLAYKRFIERVGTDYTIVKYNEYITGDGLIATAVFGVKLDTLPSTLEVSKTSDGVFYTNLFMTNVEVAINPSDGQVVRYSDPYAYISFLPSGHYKDDINNGVGGLNIRSYEKKGTNPLIFTPIDGSTNPLKDITPNLSIPDIKQVLRDKFPDWYDKSFDSHSLDLTNNDIVNTTHLPISLPTQNPINDNLDDPSYNQDTAQNGKIDPKNEIQSKPYTESMYNLDPKTDIPTVNPTDTPDDTEGGIIESGGRNGLWSVYNPTIGELESLGGYLWSSNIIEILQKFLNNPMDCIISLHMIYATPTTGERKNIVLGYLDSGVSSKTVTKQFITIDCGSVDVSEYFNDARDYTTPYTQIECYLPFIGIVRFKTEDIIGGKVNIVYTIDVLTGALMCKVFVTKLGAKQQLYTYSGNCSVQLPLTGADRTRLLSGAISGAGIGASGGAVGAIAGAVVGGFMGGSSIDRSGSFSANAGAMGIKTPYLIITRKYSYDAGNYNTFYGYPSNNTLQLSACKGYTRVRIVHVDTINNATDKEKLEIESMLKNGVIIK